ncbi:hypothetical protein GQ457_12G013800 [Hibiscus cannabinus]
MPPLSHTWNTCDLTYLNSSLLTLKPCRMSETRFAKNSCFRGSSSVGDGIGMEGNLSRQGEPQNPLDFQTIQRECLLIMQVMFDQFLVNLKQGQLVVQAVAAPSRAPIENLAQHRGYPFVGTMKEKPEYWLERITHIGTKQLSCSDEHKLESTVTLLVNEVLSWWETTTLTTPSENNTKEFFVEEFKKKYIMEQHLNERRKKFLYLKQGSEPIGQYASEFRNYCKYGSKTRG